MINKKKHFAPKETVTVIIPPVVVHHLDPHTGIPFMPHMAAYVAAALRCDGYHVQVLDSFGLQPNNRALIDDFMLLGLDVTDTVSLVSSRSKVCLIYCRTMAEFLAVESLIKEILAGRPEIKICLFENIQAVTSFSLSHVAEKFLQYDIKALILGEPENRVGAIVHSMIQDFSLNAIPGLIFRHEEKGIYYTEAVDATEDLDSLAIPAWDIFPLEGYWIAGFAHGPCGKERFLPLLTSRGCPYKCKFCLSPFVNPTWRSRSARKVVDEIEYFYKTMNILDFHVSDLNPTVDEYRIQEICKEILLRKLSITWKLAQGTKIETIKNEETLELMAESGCKFIAFSPETGSKKLLKTVGKPFDHEHGLRMAGKMVQLGINVQACFLAGLPEETSMDQELTIDYAKKLVKLGVDEISCYIFTPVPGSELSNAIEGFEHYSQCTPSPNWRVDYKELCRFRYKMYRMYFLFKLRYPKKFFYEIKGLLTGNFKSKMTMSLFKQCKLIVLRFVPFVFKQLNYEEQLKKIKIDSDSRVFDSTGRYQ